MTFIKKEQYPHTGFLLLLLCPLVTLWALSLDLYLPFIPDIMKYFSCTESVMQKANGLFMLTMAFGQLFFGPLSDQFGRLLTLMISHVIFLVGSMFCLLSPTLYPFIFGRILQALGGCGLYLSAFAYIRSLYSDHEQSAILISYLNVIGSASAILAPSLGTLLGQTFGWQGVFILLMLLVAVSMVCMLLHFSRKPVSTKKLVTQAKKIVLYDIFSQYRKIFNHPQFFPYTLPATVAMAGYFGLYSLSPFIYMHTFQLSKATFSLCYGCFGLAFFFGSLSCGLMLKFYPITKILRVGLSVSVCLFFLALLVQLYLSSPFYLLNALFVMIIFSFGINTSAGIGQSMAPFKNTPGMAFALLSAAKFFIAFLLSELLMTFYNGFFLQYTVLFLLLHLSVLFYIHHTESSAHIITPN